jgi:citrate lyase gamma subunit
MITPRNIIPLKSLKSFIRIIPYSKKIIFTIWLQIHLGVEKLFTEHSERTVDTTVRTRNIEVVHWNKNISIDCQMQHDR